MKCSKIRYRDRVAALLALANTQHKDSSTRTKTERRAYKCPNCKGFHLTSAPLRKKSK